MRKHISIIATAIITGSIAMAGAMSSFATEDLTPGMPLSTNHCTEMSQFETETVSVDAVQFKADEVQAPTEAPTEASTQAPTEAPTQAPTEAPTQAPTEAPVQAAMAQADAEAKALSAVTSTGDKPENFSVTSAAYDNAGGFWTITVRRNNGNDIRIYKVTADAVTRTDIDESTIIATTAAPTTTAKAQSTTTAAATKAATKAAAKTTANKNSSPKTGVAFPAIPVAGMAIAAVAVAFTLKKKSN